MTRQLTNKSQHQIDLNRYQQILAQFRSKHKLTQPSNKLPSQQQQQPTTNRRQTDKTRTSYSHLPNLDLYRSGLLSPHGFRRAVTKRSSKSEPGLFPSLVKTESDADNIDALLPRHPSYPSTTKRTSENEPTKHRHHTRKRREPHVLGVIHHGNGYQTLHSSNFQHQQGLKSKVDSTPNGVGLPLIQEKIERYRLWHEEQYKQKLSSKLEKLENELNVNNDENGSLSKEISSKKAVDAEKDKDDESSSRSTPPAPVPTDIHNRVFSSKTWRTWRDVNDSYAYCDVEKYLKDNELMTSEKRKRIEKWINEVMTPRTKSPDENDVTDQLEEGE